MQALMGLLSLVSLHHFIPLSVLQSGSCCLSYRLPRDVVPNKVARHAVCSGVGSEREMKQSRESLLAVLQPLGNTRLV